MTASRCALGRGVNTGARVQGLFVKPLLAVTIAFALSLAGPTAGAQEEPSDAPESISTHKTPKKAQKRRSALAGGLWFHGGLNFAWVQESQHNCPGAQWGATAAKGLYVRYERTYFTFEADDDGGNCDVLVAGDSLIEEEAITVGILLGHTGLFVGGGRADIDAEIILAAAPFGQPQDRGAKYEIGWSDQGGRGLEIVLSRTLSEVRNVTALSVNLAFGWKH
jgi:hypothetical protein